MPQYNGTGAYQATAAATNNGYGTYSPGIFDRNSLGSSVLMNENGYPNDAADPTKWAYYATRGMDAILAWLGGRVAQEAYLKRTGQLDAAVTVQGMPGGGAISINSTMLIAIGVLAYLIFK